MNCRKIIQTAATTRKMNKKRMNENGVENILWKIDKFSKRNALARTTLLAW